MREQGAVRHPGNHMYSRMTPAVYGDGFNGSAKEAALEALLVDIREKARRENGFSRKRVAEMQAEVLAYRQRAEHAERELELVKVSRRFNTGIFYFSIYAGAAAVVAIAAAAAAAGVFAEKHWLTSLLVVVAHISYPRLPPRLLRWVL